jgi:hypothetical protein
MCLLILNLGDLGGGFKLAGRKEFVWLGKVKFSKVQNHLMESQFRSAATAISPEIAVNSNGLHGLSVDDVESGTICRLNPEVESASLVRAISRPASKRTPMC